MARYEVKFKTKGSSNQPAKGSTVRSAMVTAESRADARGEILSRYSNIGNGVVILSVIKK